LNWFTIWHSVDVHFADADLSDKGMGAAIAPLRGIAECQEEALVSARQRLQAQVTRHGKFHRFAGEVARLVGFRKGAVRLDQSLMGQDVRDAHDLLLRRRAACRRLDRLVLEKRRVEKAVRVVEGRTEQLTARQILVGGRHAPFDLHLSGIDRHGRAEARERGPVGTQEEDRLDQVAARLAHGQCRKRTVVERSLGHHAIDGQSKLLDDLLDRERRQGAVAAAPVGEQPVSIVDGGLATFDSNIHACSPAGIMSRQPLGLVGLLPVRG
jgi:hypothetical protein